MDIVCGCSARQLTSPLSREVEETETRYHGTRGTCLMDTRFRMDTLRSHAVS